MKRRILAIDWWIVIRLCEKWKDELIKTKVANFKGTKNEKETRYYSTHVANER